MCEVMAGGLRVMGLCVLFGRKRENPAASCCVTAVCPMGCCGFVVLGALKPCEVTNQKAVRASVPREGRVVQYMHHKGCVCLSIQLADIVRAFFVFWCQGSVRLQREGPLHGLAVTFAPHEPCASLIV
jgi:hypothetical protein